MPLFEKHPTLMLGIWKIEESVSDLLTLLNKPEMAYPFLTDCRSESRKKEWLATRVLLKELLGEQTDIAYYPDGSPYLPDKEGMFISISHTKDYVAVYCTRENPVGIDIEHRSSRVLKIKTRFLTEEELVMIEPEHEIEHLLICWCAKETLFKLIKQTDVDFRDHLHIRPFPFRDRGELGVWETKTARMSSFALSFCVTPFFVLTYSL